jgi:hypothetical protein
MPAVLLSVVGDALVDAMVIPAQGQQNAGRFGAHSMNLSGVNGLGKRICAWWRNFNDEWAVGLIDLREIQVKWVRFSCSFWVEGAEPPLFAGEIENLKMGSFGNFIFNAERGTRNAEDFTKRREWKAGVTRIGFPKPATRWIPNLNNSLARNVVPRIDAN